MYACEAPTSFWRRLYIYSMYVHTPYTEDTSTRFQPDLSHVIMKVTRDRQTCTTTGSGYECKRRRLDVIAHEDTAIICSGSSTGSTQQYQYNMANPLCRIVRSTCIPYPATGYPWARSLMDIGRSLIRLFIRTCVHTYIQIERTYSLCYACALNGTATSNSFPRPLPRQYHDILVSHLVHPMPCLRSNGHSD